MSIGDPNPQGYNYNSGYAAGYADGFRAGFEAGRGANAPSVPPQTGYKCQVCGMFFEYGKAYGYVCNHITCPSRVTCTWNGDNTANVSWSSWMSGRPMK